MQFQAGVPLPYATALWQLSEIAVRASVVSCWTFLAYRTCYAACAKRTQSLSELMKTGLYAVTHKRAHEGLALLLLVLCAVGSGFFTTIVTANGNLGKVSSRTISVSLARSLSNSELLGEDLVSVIASATGNAHKAEDWSLDEIPATDLEQVEVPAQDLLAPEGYVWESLLSGYSRQIPLWMSGCDGLEPAETPDGSRWWRGTGRCTEPLNETTNGRITLYWALDPWTMTHEPSRQDSLRLDTMFELGYTQDRLVFQRDLTTFTGSANTTTETKVWCKLSSFPGGDITDGDALLPAALPSNPKHGEVYYRNEIFKGVGVIVQAISGIRYEAHRLGGNFRGFEAVRKTVMLGNSQQAGRVRRTIWASSHGQKAVSEGEKNMEILYSQGEDADTAQRRQHLRAVDHLLRGRAVNVSETRAGYSLRYVLMTTLLPCMVFLATLGFGLSRPPFENNTLAENLYTNNDAVIDDCASNAWARDKKWWYPERWATTNIRALSDGEHVTVVLDGRAYKPQTLPSLMQTLDRHVPLRHLKAAQKYWSTVDYSAQQDHIAKFIRDRSARALQARQTREREASEMILEKQRRAHMIENLRRLPLEEACAKHKSEKQRERQEYRSRLLGCSCAKLVPSAPQVRQAAASAAWSKQFEPAGIG